MPSFGKSQFNQNAIRSKIDFHWVTGVSIGAINASIIVGNPPTQRVDKLRSFWSSVTANIPPTFLIPPDRLSNKLYGLLSALRCLTFGVPGFFLPRFGQRYDEVSFYDTAPLQQLLERHVDFDLINSGKVRLSLGSVNVLTGEMMYFNSRTMRIGPEIVMASGALPPGFPPIKVNGEYFWDGGLVSNTPLSYVLRHASAEKTLVFEVDLFNPVGALPQSIGDVLERHKDIVYSSRTRTNVDNFRENYDLRRALATLRKSLPPEVSSRAEISRLLAMGEERLFSVVRLVYREAAFEGPAKDCEFSAASMRRHWEAGRSAGLNSASSTEWRTPPVDQLGIALFEVDEKGNTKNLLATAAAPTANMGCSAVPEEQGVAR